jgi:hypothetical protein
LYIRVNATGLTTDILDLSFEIIYQTIQTALFLPILLMDLQLAENTVLQRECRRSFT